MPLEKSIERYLDLAVREAGGITRKWVSPGRRGVPDRICIFPGPMVVFVELKAPGGELRPEQEREHQRLRALGCDVRVIASRVAVREFLAEVRR